VEERNVSVRMKQIGLELGLFTIFLATSLGGVCPFCGGGIEVASSKEGIVVKYELKQLPYAFNALEPYLDARTVEIHYTKHHKGYVDKLNAALDKHPELFKRPLVDLLTHLDALPEDIRTDVRNQGGGHWAHEFFWNCMAAPSQSLTGQREPDGELKKAIGKQFGSFDEFKKAFTKAATGAFGSGWCWLVQGPKGELEIISTPNHGIPQQQGKKPLLVVDIWEHAYYLKFQNRRPEYIEAWWNVVNWPFVAAQWSKE